MEPNSAAGTETQETEDGKPKRQFLKRKSQNVSNPSTGGAKKYKYYADRFADNKKDNTSTDGPSQAEPKPKPAPFSRQQQRQQERPKTAQAQEQPI
jgi:hypothetical protein